MVDILSPFSLAGVPTSRHLGIYLMCSVIEHSLGQWYLELPVCPCSPDPGSGVKSAPWALLAFLLGASRDPHGLGPEGI